MAGSENFEMPSKMEKVASDAEGRYAKFVTEPWENGFGNTLGNSLRRVLLTMMEGVAVSCIRIDGISHEFTPIPGVMEDVMEIILNIKKLKFRANDNTQFPRTLELLASKGEITGADIKEDGIVSVLNKDLKLFTITDNYKGKPIRIELDLDKGRGYRPSERNVRDEQPVNSIPVDCLFSPIEKVHYDVQPSRVGENTNYDRLELEVWTDARISPEAAVMKAAQILRKHLEVFEFGNEIPGPGPHLTLEEQKLVEKLSANVSTLGLSVRSVNCLNQDNIHFLGELVQKTEAQMMKCRNFGRVSLNEIREKLQEMDLSLEFTLPNNVAAELARRMANQLQTTTKE